MLYSLLHSSYGTLPRSLQTPEERFTPLTDFPFTPHYVTIESAASIQFQVHYVDESPSPFSAPEQTILLLHGEPSWSYLYRGFVKPLTAAGYRVVMLDFAGFGKSDKFTEMSDYTHEMHCRTLIEFMAKLDLRKVTLFVQDWGGLTGLSALREVRACETLSTSTTSLIHSSRHSSQTECHTW